MWNTLLAATAVLTITVSTPVLAQSSGDGGNRYEAYRRERPTVEDLQARVEARLAGLKALLSLTDEQAANWSAFEQATREWHKLRIDRMMAERRDNAPADPAERLRRRGTEMADSGAALKKLADALDGLYKSLNDNQKRRFAAFDRAGGRSRDFARRHNQQDERFGRRGDRDFGGRDGRDFRGGRDDRDFRGGRDGRDFRGGRDGRDFRGGRDGRDFRGEDFRGGRSGREFPEGWDDYGYEPQEFGRGLDGRRYGPDDDRRGPRSGDDFL